MLTPRQTIQKAFNGQPNFVTPDHIESGFIGQKYAYEISEGDFLDGPNFGLSIVDRKTCKSLPNLSSSFSNMSSLRATLNRLHKEVE